MHHRRAFIALLTTAAALAPAAVALGSSLYGTNGDDYIYGSHRGDGISALAGNDVVRGLGGDDHVSAGEGNDLVFGDSVDSMGRTVGAPGADHLYGDAGTDLIYGGEGGDFLDGGADNDRLYGEAANDTMVGGKGVDLLDGGPGDDVLNVSGDGWVDYVHCGDGWDTVHASSGGGWALPDRFIDKQGQIVRSSEAGCERVIWH